MRFTNGRARSLVLIFVIAFNVAVVGTLGCGGAGGNNATAGVAGSTGAAGAGTQGTAGTTGSAGTTGTAGSGDTTGTAGTTGVAGTTGEGGSTGTAGTGGTGASGIAGAGGIGGATGGRGGTSGRGGTTGAAGAGARGGTTGTAGAGARGGTTGSAGTGGTTTANFSFFVTSIGALRMLSGSQDGFGGDLRFGETGDGAGLRGADKICTAIAELSMPGSGAKVWHAFLSAPATATTPVVNAIERIGTGPWYDRLGRLFSANLTNLMATRPTDADAGIKNDFPNEDGVPNHSDGAPGCTGNSCPDNHDMLTGSGSDGKLYTNTSNPTCSGWTSAVGSAGKPRVGHSWPRGTTGNSAHWMSSLDEAGCAPGINLQETGGPNPSNPTVGSGGGYGGFYCFAMTP